MNIDNVLRRNYQRISTNRFIVDSPRFWRREFHPRFKDVFEFSEFVDVLEAANNTLSFKYDSTKINVYAAYLYEWFSGYRFSNIPAKDPNSPQQFLSELYFSLLDVLPQISMTDYTLDRDDFNVVTHRAETGKNDTSKVGTNESNKQASRILTEADILSNSELRQVSTANTENIDEETEQNTKTVNDVFLSPQNQGVQPETVNTKHKGVDGIDLNPGGSFTTNTANTLLGDSIKNKANTSAQGQQAEDALTQNNDIKTAHEINTDMQGGQVQENTTAKNDNYVETLDFNKGARLQDFFNLNNNRLWRELLARLSRWILQIDIATADRNYNDCPMWD